MDITTKQWVVGIILVVIIAIVLDGLRRMRNARRDSLHMSLNTKINSTATEHNKEYGSEFPNGGARVSNSKIDTDRIAEVRSQYDFGSTTRFLDEEPTSDEQEQWVDVGEDDEEYYAQQWDDEETQNEPVVEEVDTSDHLTAEHKPLENVDQQPDHSDEGLKGEYSEPEQVPLNLEESVPVLMDTVGGENEEGNETAAPDYTAEIQSVGKRIEPTIDDDAEENLDTHSANKPRYESKYFSSQATTVPEDDHNNEPSIEEVLVVNIKAPLGEQFAGSDLLQQVLKHDLRFGVMNVFHHHANQEGEGPVLFSMANMLKPGTFDLKTIDEFATAGVTFFLTLPTYNNDNMTAFEKMLQTSQSIAAELGGELKDEQRNIMTAQTIEHYRERVRDFARRQQLAKSQ